MKTLEEPPSYVIFILATTDPQKIPSTILSRCQRYDLKRINSSIIAKRLLELCDAEGRQAESRAIDYIAKSADGSMRDALSLLDRCFSFYAGKELSYKDTLEILGAADITVFSELYRAICGFDIETALRLISDTVAAGREIYQFVNDFIWYLRNVLLAMSTEDVSGLIDASEENLERFKEDAGLCEKPLLIEIMSRMAELSNRLRFAKDKRTLLEVELIRLCTRDIEPLSQSLPAESGAAAASKDRKPVKREPEGRNLQQSGELPGDSMPQAKAQRIDDKKTTGSAAPVHERAESPEEEKKDRKLPEAPLDASDAIGLIRRHWGALISGLAASNRYLYENSFVKEEDGRPVVVFKSSMSFKIASTNKEENGLTRLSELCREELSLDVRFGGRVARRGELENAMDSITDEERSRINFPVDIEN